MNLSVLMTVYNNQPTLNQAIESILSQTYQGFIFYIVDDASSDNSAQILADFAKQDQRIKLITNQRHLGLTRSLNKALRFIKTPYIARMDADDIALPARFAKQIQFLEKHPQIMLLGTAAYLIDDNNTPLGLKRYPSDHQQLRRQILKYCPFIHPTWMLRRSVLQLVGDYNPDFLFSQDYELALRIAGRFKTANLAEPLLKYRVNSPTAISLLNLKTQERLALQARLTALFRQGYSFAESWKLIKPLLSFLVPVGIKKLIYRQFYWR